MNKAFLVILSVVIILVSFGLGAGVGVFYQMQKNAPQINKAEEVIKKLTSKALPLIVVYGQIINIEGKNLTVSFNGESVDVKINENATISMFSTDSQGKSSQQNFVFNQIKIGQTVSVNTKVSLDGQLQGEAITIFPSTAPTK